MSSMNIPIFIPHFGCPNGCVFCNQQKISGKDELDDEKTIRKLIESSIETSGDRDAIEIAFFGGSFTGLEQHVQSAYLNIANEYVKKYNLRGIRLSTRPDYINQAVMEYLSDYPITAIELGVQSLDEDVLLQTKRNHTIQDVESAVVLIKKAGIELGLQMMIGLPGDTLEKSIASAKKIICFQPDTVRIYPTLVLQDTQLNNMFQRGKYTSLTVEEAVSWTSQILPLFIKAHIRILRVGLQANEGLNGDVVITGPYHPAFKELVLDKMVYDELERLLLSQLSDAIDSQFSHLGQATIQLEFPSYNDETLRIVISKDVILLVTSPKMVQRLIGHKKKNLEKIQTLFNTVLKKELCLRIQAF